MKVLIEIEDLRILFFNNELRNVQTINVSM